MNDFILFITDNMYHQHSVCFLAWMLSSENVLKAPT